MDDKDAQLRGKLEDLRFASDLSDSFQAKPGPGAPEADRPPIVQPLAALRTLAENTTDAILLSDLAGRVTFSNRACCDLLGYDYTQNEMVGLETTALWPDEEKARLTGETPSGVPPALTREWRGEVMQRRKDGSLLKTSLVFFPVCDEQERPIAMALLLHDLTERKQAEAEREHLMATLARRAVQLQTSAEVSRAATSILSLDELLPQTVELIRDRFDLYYTGIFLTDETGQWAVLRAGTGQAGQKMLEADHRLQIGGSSMIGWCIANAQSHIALDVGEEAVRFGNPLLPLTRSEMALPLVSRGRVIGAMTIQSTQPAAFSQEDATLLQTTAEQVATTIENARLFEQTQAARQQAEARLHEMQILQKVIQAASGALDLERILDALFDALTREMGFTYVALNLIDEPANEVRTVRAAGLARGMNGVTRPLSQMQNDILLDVTRKGRIEVIDGWDDRHDRVVYEREGHAALVRAFVPLLLQEKSVGVLEAGYKRQERAVITPEEIRLLGSFASQVAVAVENARLFAQVQRRAREQEGLGRVAALAGSTLKLDELLDRLMEEARQLLGAADALMLVEDQDKQALVGRYVSIEGIPSLTPEEWHVPMSAPGFEQSIFARGGGYYSDLGLDDPNIIPAYRPCMEALHVRNFCGVALRARERSVGELYLANRPEGFGTDELRLLRAVAGYAANAIQNARLFEEAQRLAAREQTLNTIAARVRAGLTLDQVLGATVQEIGTALGAARVAVQLDLAGGDEQGNGSR